MFMTRSTVRTEPTLTTIPFRATGCRPVSFAVTSYFPAFR